MHLPVYSISKSAVQCRCAARTDGVVLYQGPWAKIAQLHRAKPGADVVHGERQRGDSFNRTGDAVTANLAIAKAGTRERNICIDREPVCGFVVTGNFKTSAATRSASFGRARITNKYQFRVELQAID